MPFDPDEFLRNYNKISFKDKKVKDSYTNLDKNLISAAEESPYPLTITSAYRSPEENLAVGGVPNSYHTRGGAIDLRLDKNTPLVSEYFKSKGFKPLRESDHLHIEPTGSNFDPDSFISEFSNNDSSSDIPIKELSSKKSLKNIKSKIAPTIRSFVQSATANLSEPVIAGGSALVEEALQLAGTVPERSLGESYDYYKKIGEEELKRLQKENPALYYGTQIAGVVSPGGAYSQGLKGAKALTKAAKLASIPKVGGLITPAVEAGLASAAYSGINPDKNDALQEGLLGAAGDVATRGLSKIAKPLLRRIPLVGPALSEAERSEALLKQEAKNQLKEKTLSELGKTRETIASFANSLGAKGKQVTGENLQKNIQSIYTKVKNDYGSLVSPILKSAKNEKASPDKLISTIDNFLAEEGLFKNGKVFKEGLESIVDSERKDFYRNLIKIKDSFNPKSLKSKTVLLGPDALPIKINKDFTIGEYDKLVKGLQSLAKFDRIDRSQYNKLFGSLSREAREDFLDNLGKYVSPEEFETFTKGRSLYADNASLFEKNLLRLTKKTPESVISSSALPGSKISKAIDLQPGLKEPITGIVLTRISDKILTNKTPNSLTNIIDDYGRDTLKKLLGPEKFSQLMDLESQFHRVYKASKNVDITKNNTFMEKFKNIFPESGKYLAPAIELD